MAALNFHYCASGCFMLCNENKRMACLLLPTQGSLCKRRTFRALYEFEELKPVNFSLAVMSVHLLLAPRQPDLWLWENTTTHARCSSVSGTAYPLARLNRSKACS